MCLFVDFTESDLSTSMEPAIWYYSPKISYHIEYIIMGAMHYFPLWLDWQQWTYIRTIKKKKVPHLYIYEIPLVKPIKSYTIYSLCFHSNTFLWHYKAHNARWFLNKILWEVIDPVYTIHNVLCPRAVNLFH